jgi:hypothetical protein
VIGVIFIGSINRKRGFKMFCNHDWEVIEYIRKKLDFGDNETIPKLMFNEKYQVICICRSCGKIKKFVCRSE